MQFSEPMFDAVIEWRKTQTRRLVNPQPNCPYQSKDGNFYDACRGNEEDDEIKPRYKAGEIVYIKEPFVVEWYDKKNWGVWYKYTDYDAFLPTLKWTPARHMPAKYARHFIKITGVRCERVQEITESDCLKEGILKVNSYSTWKLFSLPDSPNYSEFYTAQQAYAALFDQINGKGAWDSNTYVWVYDFEFVKK